MKLYWLFQRRKDGLWDGIEDSEWEKLHGEDIIAGSTHLLEAENLCSALTTVMSEEDVISRIFADVQTHRNDHVYHKWFSSSEDN